jgi:putative ABC transport system permease protein
MMRTLREWMHRLVGVVMRQRRDEDLEEELRLHVELAVEEAHRRGQAAHEAVRTARLRSGSTLGALDALRDQRGISWIDELSRDVRYGLRTLRRSPSFTAVALLTLALGIGANAAIYQLLDAVRIRTLPVKDPEQLVMLELADVTRFAGRRASIYDALPNPVWEQVRERDDLFSGLLAWSNVELRLDRGVGPPVARGLLVSGDFFSVLGVGPHLGRTLTRADDRPGCGVPGAVVSYAFWQQNLGGDPGVVGRTLSLNSQQVEVIGVTAPGFSGLEIGRSFDVAVPICSQAALGGESSWLRSGTVWWLTVMGRVPPGRSLDLVNRQLMAASPAFFEASLPPDYPPEFAKDYLSYRLKATPVANGVSSLRRRFADPLLILQLTTGLVLFVACTNLANLVLARASAREREFALRLAVGGSWGRLVRQQMVENGLIALGGAIAGLACAAALSRVLVGLLGAGLSLELRVDLRLIGVMVGLASLTCLTFGLIPAWRASRVAAVDAMKASSRTASGAREGTGLRRILVVTQVACSLVLLFGGLLFAGTLRNLMTVETGFESERVTVTRVDFSGLGLSPASRTATIANVLQRIRQLPEVASAAETRHVPLGGTGTTLEAWNESATASAKTLVRINGTSPGYLKTMGIALIGGRDFDDRDVKASPKVAIVNPAFMRKLGLGDNPVGQTFRGSASPGASELYQIVGLTPDTKYSSLREDPVAIAFVPMTQITDPRPFTDIVVRSALPLAQISSAVSRAVADVNSSIGTLSRPFEATIRAGILSERFMAILSGLFGVLAALIAAIGLYGVMSYLVVRRTNEIGVRMALGARRADVLTIVLGEAGILVTIGLAIGAAASLAAAGSVRALVFGLEPHNPLILGLACGLLAVIGIVASYLPARRAANLPPLLALRER